jgi:uncharacterized protein YxeA
MKKYVTGLAAVILAISASAFTKATQKEDGEFRLVDGVIVAITEPGECKADGEFCKYYLIEGQDNDGNPLHYVSDGIPNRHWEKTEVK